LNTYVYVFYKNTASLKNRTSPRSALPLCKAKNLSKGEGAVYDLQCRKVDVKKMRGIYIKNGKKYVIL